MLTLLIIMFFIQNTSCFEKPCSSCKFFISHNNNLELGLCNAFKENSLNKDDKIIRNFAKHYRNDENLCGKFGLLYESNNNYKELIEINEQLKNLCCGEVNEQEDIKEFEQIEKELFNIQVKK